MNQITALNTADATPATVRAVIMPIATDEIAAILEPFVGARFNRDRDANGYVLPRRSFVDIAYGRHGCLIHGDADVREATDEGITVQFDGRLRMTRWGEIHAVTIRGEGAATYEVVAEPARVAPMGWAS